MRQLLAEPEGWFAQRYVFYGDGQPVGSFDPKAFSEELEVHLTDERRLVFSKAGWFSSTFELTDPDTEQRAGHASSEGVISTQWSLQTSAGALELTTQSIFSRACRATLAEQPVIELEPLGAWTRGWTLRDLTESFDLVDLLLVGLTYHTILERWKQSGGGAAGGADGGGGA